MRAPKYPMMPGTLGNIRPERDVSVSELTRAQKGILANTSATVPVTGQYYDLIRAGQQVQTSAPTAFTNAKVRGVFNKAGGVRSFAAAGYNYPSGQMVIGAALSGLGFPPRGGTGGRAPLVEGKAQTRPSTRTATSARTGKGGSGASTGKAAAGAATSAGTGAAASKAAAAGTLPASTIASVAAATQQLDVAKKALAAAEVVNSATFREVPLDWHDLPNFKQIWSGGFNTYDSLADRVQQLMTSADTAILQGYLTNPSSATKSIDPFLAWVILRLMYRPNNSVPWSALVGKITDGKADFKKGANWSQVDNDPEAQLASDAVTLNNAGVPNWARAWGVTLRRAIVWADKYGTKARAAAIKAAKEAIATANNALALAVEKADLDARLAAAETSGGYTQSEVDTIKGNLVDAKAAAEQTKKDLESATAANQAALQAAAVAADQQLAQARSDAQAVLDATSTASQAALVKAQKDAQDLLDKANEDATTALAKANQDAAELVAATKKKGTLVAAGVGAVGLVAAILLWRKLKRGA